MTVMMMLVTRDLDKSKVKTRGVEYKSRTIMNSAGAVENVSERRWGGRRRDGTGRNRVRGSLKGNVQGARRWIYREEQRGRHTLDRA